MSQINEMVTKAKLGDFESMEYILQFFKPKVTAICREYFLLGADFDDLLQEGMIGLYKSIMAFNESKTDKFSAELSRFIFKKPKQTLSYSNLRSRYKYPRRIL